MVPNRMSFACDPMRSFLYYGGRDQGCRDVKHCAASMPRQGLDYPCVSNRSEAALQLSEGSDLGSGANADRPLLPPQCLERAMKCAFGEFHLWYQVALSMVACGKVRPRAVGGVGVKLWILRGLRSLPGVSQGWRDVC